MIDSKESQVTEKEPRTPTVDQLNELMEVEEGRRARRKVTTTWGAIGFFGIVDFVAALVRGTLGLERFFSLAIALLFSAVAIGTWWESRRPEIPEEDESASPQAD
jgi:hypothetical protein